MVSCNVSVSVCLSLSVSVCLSVRLSLTHRVDNYGLSVVEGIPYLLRLEGCGEVGHCIKGELFAVNDALLAYLDDFEGVPVG
jgi:hypothetical protein